MLVFIGMGLSIKHITLEALEYLHRVEKVVIDTYTGFVPEADVLFKEFLRGKEVVYASRQDLEGASICKLVEEAKYRDIALLVPGDPFIATTHDAIRIEALKQGVKVVVVNGLSIYSLAASRTGLQAYRFGKTITLIYPDFSKPYSVVETIYDNLSRNLHTLLLLDFRRDEERYMSIVEAIDILIDLDERGLLKNLIGVGLARIGTSEEFIVADKLIDLKNYEYPSPPHSIVVVAKPHPIELDNLRYLCNLPYTLYVKYLKSKTYP